MTTLLLLLAIAGSAMDRIAAGTDATVGVAAVNLESGERLGLRDHERFPMGSVFKFPLAIAVLRNVDARRLTLAQSVTIEPKEFSPGYSPIRDSAHGRPVTLTVGELLEASLGASDNTAADALLRIAGGPAAVTRVVRSMGVRGMRVDRSEKEMAADLDKGGGVERYAVDPRDTATPAAAVELLVKFYRGQDGLTPSSHDLALRVMTQSKTSARRIRSILPPGGTLAHKSGTMPGTQNDIGIISTPDGRTHVAVAIFTKARRRSTEQETDAVIAGLARWALERLTPP